MNNENANLSDNNKSDNNNAIPSDIDGADKMTSDEYNDKLDAAIKSLAEYRERADDMRAALNVPPFYTIAAIVLAAVAACAMFYFAAPRAAMVAGAITVMLAITVFIYGKTRNGKAGIDRMKLAAPILRGVERKRSLYNFTKTLSEIARANVDISSVSAIQNAVAMSRMNSAVSKQILEACEKIGDGSDAALSDVLEHGAIFPPMILYFLKNGANEAEALTKIYEFYGEEIEAATDAIMSLAQPAAIGVTAAMSLGILAVLYVRAAAGAVP